MLAVLSAEISASLQLFSSTASSSFQKLREFNTGTNWMDKLNGTNWNVKAWQSGKCQGLPVLLSPSPSMSWQMAEGKHWCHAGRDHRTQCEIALKSAVKKKPVLLQSLQALTPVLPHFFHRHRYWEKYTLNNLQHCRLFRNVDLCFDLQIFLNLLVAGLLEIAHV